MAVAPGPRPWTREEYERAAQMGLFRPDERLELIRGEIIQKMSPQNAPHAATVSVAAQELADAFGPGYYVREEKPLIVGGDSVPEPDIVVVRGSGRDYRSQHPTAEQVLLLVEVSDSTLAYDRREKAALYAAAGITDYWIINLPENRLEVYRDPVPVGSDFTYRVTTIFRDEDTVTPLQAPQAAIEVDALLP